MDSGSLLPEEVIASSETASALPSPPSAAQETTGIAQKLSEFQDRINQLSDQISRMTGAINAVADTVQEVTHTHSNREEQLLEMNRLRDEKDKLRDEKDKLRDEKDKLLEIYSSGRYYAATHEYWGKRVYQKGSTGVSFFVEGQKKRVPSFWRTQHRAIECRQARSKNSTITSQVDIYTMDEYTITRDGANQSDAETAKEQSTKNSSKSQGAETIRNKIWPVDIFGNPAMYQQIAHLLPAGQKYHKEWIQIAAAVVGLNTDATGHQKRIAARGYYENSGGLMKGTKDGPRSQLSASVKSDTQSSSSADMCSAPLAKKARSVPKITAKSAGSKSGTKRLSRKSGSGVIHFVTNKMRLDKQKEYIDGSNPRLLILPVMTLQQCTNWQGEAYTAIVMAGHPHNSELKTSDEYLSTIAQCYTSIGANTEFLKTYRQTRDATNAEIATARMLLADTIVEVETLLANMTDLDIEDMQLLGKTDAIEEARRQAREGNFFVPVLVNKNEQKAEPRPVCLVTFGHPLKDTEMHPPPDPLLLACRAARTWASLTNFRMLAAGSLSDDEYSSMGDMTAEHAYFDAVFGGAKRPNSWEELAAGLGQPNGYVDST